jgi:hypothetical protein
VGCSWVMGAGMGVGVGVVAGWVCVDDARRRLHA